MVRKNRRRSSGPRLPARNRSSERQALHQPHQRPEARLDEAQDPQADESGRVVGSNRRASDLGRRRTIWSRSESDASSLNLVFCGTPAFAVPTLERLVEAGFPVPLVVTQPDRPNGRGMELALSPVKQAALRLGLQISSAGQDQEQRRISSAIVCHRARRNHRCRIRAHHSAMDDRSAAAGNLNLHGSLLPKYRGAAPIQWAIARGET